MKRYRRVWVVYRKELKETLRDRRTLIAMVVVPIVLYPVLFVVLIEALKTETSRREASHYSVCVPTEAHRAWVQGVLDRDAAERAAGLAAYEEAAEAGEPVAEFDGSFRAYLRSEQVTLEVVGPETSLWDLVADQTHHAGVLIAPPPDAVDAADPAQAPNRVVQVIYRGADTRSEFVFEEFNRIFAYEAARIVKARVAGLARGEDLLTPLVMNNLSTAGTEMQFARVLATLLPFLLVTMTVTGAMYPAIDLTAGERERGTLETLAVSPVPVGQIVAGKFSVIVTIAMISTMLNLASMTAMAHFSKLDRLASALQPDRQADALAIEEAIERTGPSGESALSQRDYLRQRRDLEANAVRKTGFLTMAVPAVMLAMVPFAVLFAGIMLAVCSFARTFKEAQNYMMPVMMGAIVPAMVVSYMPTIKLEGAILVMPVANVALLMRDLFLGQYDLAAMGVCIASTCFYAVTAVAVAAKLFGHEAVIFSDVGSYKTLLKRRFIKPQSLPSAAFALLMVAVLFPVNFYWQSYLLEADSSVAWFRGVIAAAQVLILAAPVVLLGWYAKLDLRRTFSLYRPAGRPLLGALLIAFAIVPVSNLLQQIQFSFWPPASLPDQFTGIPDEWFIGGSLAGILFTLALLPGICEELLFRGFLLGGLRRKLSTTQLVLVVGLIFGLYHISSEKIPIVSLMGMLLVFICLRADSIFPAMLVHAANNGLALAATRIEGLRTFCGLPDPSVETVAIQFDARAALFLFVFVVGLALMAASRGRGSASNATGS